MCDLLQGQAKLCRSGSENLQASMCPQGTDVCSSRCCVLSEGSQLCGSGCTRVPTG